MAKTKRDVIDLALQHIGVVPIGMQSEGEDYSRTEKVYDSVFSALDDVHEIGVSFTENVIPDWAYFPLAQMVASRVCAGYGKPEFVSEYARGLRHIRAYAANESRVQGRPVRVDYFAMPRLQFVGQSARDDDNEQGNTSRLVNFYREPLGQGGKSQFALKSVLGTSLFLDTGSLFVRDMIEVGGLLYVMAGATLFRVTPEGGSSALGSTVSKEGARLFGAELGRICTITDGRYFVWDGATMSEPTVGAFNKFGSGAFFNNYVLLSEQNGRRFQWSDLADAKTLPGLSFATAESTDGNILRIVPLQGRVLLMKEDVIEQWYATGQPGANAFTRLAGGVTEIGLKSAGLVTRFTGGVFFVGNDDIAYIGNGGQFQPISGPAVNTSIAQSTPVDCFSYEDEGHIFCVIRFRDRAAWVYDIATAEWHERATRENEPWALRRSAKVFGSWYAGDDSGKVYKLERNNLDGTSPLIRRAASATLYNEGEYFTVSRVEFTGRMGRGLDNSVGSEWTLHFTDGRDYFDTTDDIIMDGTAIWWERDVYVDEPSLLVRFSGDGGLTWGREWSRDLGAVGEYDQRTYINGIGTFEQLAAEVTVSAPKEVTLGSDVNIKIS